MDKVDTTAQLSQLRQLMDANKVDVYSRPAEFTYFVVVVVIVAAAFPLPFPLPLLLSPLFTSSVMTDSSNT